MIEIPAAARQALQEHAQKDAPRESCGLLVHSAAGVVYHPARNLSERTGEFLMAPEDYVAAEAVGEVLAVVHSHYLTPPIPSQSDRVCCAATGLPWLIINVPTLSESWFGPEPYEAPYLEREFCYGILDCYTLVCDYYKRELGITMPRRENYNNDEMDWWRKGHQLYSLENWMAAGFVRVDAPRLHDIHVMQMRSTVPNHLGIQLDQGHMIHHLMGRLSEKTVYGGYWKHVTSYTVRHRSLA